MADISFGGLATGLPTEDLVKSLMAVERKPIDLLNATKDGETQRLKAYAEFDTRLDDLRTAVGNLNLTSQVRTTSVRLNSEESITASSSGASPGSYNIAVVQLAQVQKTVTSGFSSINDSTLGTGFFAINDTAVEINSSNNSLQGLANSINSISEKTGVAASIINDGGDSDNYHLVLTGKDGVTSFSITPNFKDGANATIPFSVTYNRPAHVAIAYVDGLKVVNNSNTLSGVIAGVTINLNKENKILVEADGSTPPVFDTTTTLNVDADTASLKEKVATFVSSYNAIMNWISAGYNDTTQTANAASTTTTDSTATSAEETTKTLSRLLRGDATINTVKRGLQSILSQAIGGSGTLKILSEVGIASQADGTLLLNNSKMDAALSGKFENVVKLFAGDTTSDGVMKKFNSYLINVTSATQGMYVNKRTRYEAITKQIDNQVLQKESLMTKIEKRIRSQFNAMEQLVSTMNAQSSYLTQQMTMLSNLTSGKSK